MPGADNLILRFCLQPVYELFSEDSRFRCTIRQELYRPEYWCEIMPAKASKANAIRPVDLPPHRLFIKKHTFFALPD